eukprot:TRINITY_DN70571_c0_g1_i1.p1 TRINITY_DN70571_c0_g1~~TRINITY_DN70571_c0_g1_i1.p1  ORF type:complete len:446 (+),score=119.26 TRINITY_DN70571_c0_g1_i1:80-1417(+)
MSFLTGFWSPVTAEVERHAEVRGELPPEICGSFLRIGPNPKNPDKCDPSLYHPFMADGMVHGIEIAGGEARYRNKWVRTLKFKTGRDKMGAGRHGLANTAMVRHAGRLLCLEEGGKPHEIALPGLETLGPHDYGGALLHSFTAHPKVCPQTGEMIFFGYGKNAVPGSPPDAVHHAVVSPAGRLLRSVPVSFRRPVMTHDMAITQNYSILMDFPLWSMRDPVRAEDRSRFGVLPRHATSGSAIRWFDAPGQYAYHVVNAWESDDASAIELFMVSAKGFSFTKGNQAQLRIHRWRFDLCSGETVADEDVCAVNCEFPVVPDSLVGRRCRYGYAARFAQKSKAPLALDGLVKVDLITGATLSHDYPSGWQGGECRFVPRRGGVSEDDGYLLVLVTDPTRTRSELRVIDARTMGPDPVASVCAGTFIPHGFHALWVAREEYAGGSRSRL